jgi:hypothetical protein
VRRLLLVPLAVLALGTAGVLAATTLPPAPASAASSPGSAEAGVSVAGTGTASAAPDVVRTQIGAETSGASVDEALRAANDAARRVVEALRGEGVAERDIQTAGVQLYPQYGPEGQQVTGYTARQDLTVVLRDLDAAGATIAVAVAAGGDAARLSGVSFTLADDTALRAQAREEAFADARVKAEQYAELAGRELGEVVSVREDAGGSSPYASGGGSAESASADAVPLAPGSAEVSVTAQVRWSLE